MQRLVYSPKAWIFIKRQNDSRPYDVSQYLVSGRVDRKVNAVSTATFTLRNPDKLFTAKSGQHAAFAPMDPVTIYLQRLRGYPVRVFTGFLDEVPYYELYPGVAEFSASCTLKRLLYTYFDPALPYTLKFLSNYGWQAYPDGSIHNQVAEMGQDPNTDGSVGNLLMATMHHIGGWKYKNLKIEGLPEDLLQRMYNLFKTFSQDQEEARQELETMIERFLGGGDLGDSGDISKYKGDVPKILYQVGRALNASTKLMLAAFETGIVESGMRNLDFGEGTSLGWRQETAEAYPGVDRRNVNQSAKRFFTEGIAIMKGQQPGKAGTGSYSESWTAGQLAQAIQGSARPGRYDEVRAEATTLMEETKRKLLENETGANDDPNKEVPDSKANDPTNERRAPRRDGREDKKGSQEAKNREKLSVTVAVDGASEGMQPIAILGREYGLGVTAGKDHHSTNTASGNRSNHADGTALDLSNGTSPTPEMDAFAKWVKENIPGMVHQLIWRDTVQYGYAQGAAVPGHMNHVHVALLPEYAQDKQRTVDALVSALGGTPLKAGPVDGDSLDASGDLNNDQRVMRATLLASTMTWASAEETFMATALRGNKSLMNDKPLMPFIQQMCEASLRQFQSMPNGDFFAFYPDYFGETSHRPPYWYIDDIEILDGRIRLSDEPLITHEYVVGDTSLTGDVMTNRIMSAGSVSIINAFVSDFVTTKARDEDKKKSKEDKNLYHAFNRVLKQDEAIQFLERYGARPHLDEDFPMIRNPLFELFLAFQRFMQAWARQFITPFTFTFMPELYPGGKVGLLEHGLQMYIEGVTHTFDYESGFTTQADLSAPAVLVDSHGRPLSNNLPTNMPTALLEVVAPGRPTDQPDRGFPENKP